LLFGIAAALFTAFSSSSVAAAQTQYFEVRMRSGSLSLFWRQPVAIEAHVLLPDSYYKEPTRHYPVMYWIQGFDGYGDPDLTETLAWQRPMRALHKEFILVFLDGMFNGGHQEFADSANNGPWGTALTTEFIPKTETYFRAINKPSARFVGGHSSGGWSALWLQVTYPDTFAGEWSISPDPVDFRDFLGVNLTAAAPVNFFKNSDNLNGESVRMFANEAGWKQRQFASFNAVFSPQDVDGKPEALFNLSTGIVDPAVARYWEQHYDISRILRDQWPSIEPKLQRKLHLFVGAQDNFHLNDSVLLLQKELNDLGSDAEIEVLPRFDHWTIFNANGGLRYHILEEAANATPTE
jgi:pimeloyl-ACP methyl ester carboxylesterase